MSLQAHYEGLSKTASARELLLGGSLGLGLGALYGIGDEKRNYRSEVFHKNVMDRALQGAGSALGGMTAYKTLRRLGANPLHGGMGGMAAGYLLNKLLAPKGKTYSPLSLYRS